jgi:GNAT superfamily N-acetyltransferase
MENRPLTNRDADQVHALVRRWERHWKIPRASTRDRAMEWLTAPSVDMSADTMSYWDDDTLIGYGLVSFMPSDTRRDLAFLAGCVDPERRGEGLGTGLLEWQLDRARHRLAEGKPELTKWARAGTWEWLDDTRRLYERHGLVAVRRFDEMLKVLDGPVPVDPPDRLQIEPWGRDRDEASLLVNNNAFADHWGAPPMSAGNWKHLLDAAETRLDLSFQGMIEGEVVGQTVCAYYPDDVETTGRRDGWVRILGVHRDWRGRGIGTALMKASFNAFVAAGFTHSMLRVDAESPTGAHLLYEKLGYSTINSSIIHERQIIL